jgi:hypothetical protein
LERALRALKEISTSGKRDKIVVLTTKEFPLCLGDLNKDFTEFSGIIIAPIKDEK